MNRSTELGLLDELLALKKEGLPFLDEAEAASPVERYLDAARFQRERERIFRRLPSIAAQSGELAQPNAFVRRGLAGVPMLITRDQAGEARAFVNVCRHRSAPLVAAESGCQRHFTCPYHAWTYDSSGRLVGVPHKRTGFPNLDLSARGLRPISCREAWGFIWVTLDGEELGGLEDFAGPLADDLAWLNVAALAPFATEQQTRRANWKVLVEGGLESYHFKVAHRETVGRLFEDNLSTYRAAGVHLRSVLARNTLAELLEKPRDEWRIREHANVLYTLMPTNQLLVQSDHIVWIRTDPRAADQTRLWITTLVPKEQIVPERESYWRANHDFTIRTLNEDFELGEGIQKALASGANTELRFGRFEGALARFNQQVEALIA